MSKMEKVIIIGSGPGGHTAAIYLGRSGLSPLMFEGFMAGGIAAGGQLTTTTEIENFPGFPNGIDGNELMQKMREQSINAGAVIITETISRVDIKGDVKKVYTEDGVEYLCTALVIATGSIAKRMGLPNEDKYWQNGISACAVCDGSLPIFRDKIIAVVGGGDSACEEAMYLSRFASKVILILRSDKFRASFKMQERILKNSKIELMYNTQVLDVDGDGKILNSLKLKNTKTGENSNIEVSGLFYAIGHVPSTAFLEGQLELDDHGYIKTKGKSSFTSVQNVFACGDVQDPTYRQAISSAGSGCIAAIDVERNVVFEKD